MKYEKGARVRARRELGSLWSGHVRTGTEGTVVDHHDPFFQRQA